MLCVVPKNNYQTSPFDGKSGWFVSDPKITNGVFSSPSTAIALSIAPTQLALQLTSFVRGADFVVRYPFVKH